MDKDTVMAFLIRWAGSKEKAERRFQTYRIRAFGGMTAAEIVAAGNTDRLISYLEGLDVGGHA